MESLNQLVSWAEVNGDDLLQRMQVLSNEIGKEAVETEHDLAKVFTQTMSDLPGGYSNVLMLIEDSSFEIVDSVYEFFEAFYNNIPKRKFTAKFENKLDEGDSVALLYLIISALQSLKKKYPSQAIDSPKFTFHHYFFLRRFFENTCGPIVQNLGRAILCIHKGQTQTAKSCIQLSINLIIRKIQPSYLRNAILKHEGQKEHLKLAGSKGRNTRWAAKDKVEAYALKRRKEKAYKNDSIAARQLTRDIMEFGRNNGHPFTDEFQAKDLIYRWFNKATKNHKDKT